MPDSAMPTDEEIEVVARAIYAAGPQSNIYPKGWDDITERHRDRLRAYARAAIIALDKHRRGE